VSPKRAPAIDDSRRHLVEVMRDIRAPAQARKESAIVSSDITCISCGMPMESVEEHAPNNPESTWCRHCSTAEGSLQSFDERFERMKQWTKRQQGLDEAAAEAATRAYMRTMPAWQHHPSLQ
jgi:hypothetical protein